MPKTIERIVFLQGDKAIETLNMLETDGIDAVLTYLQAWHYPGEHETAKEYGHGIVDRVYKHNNYTLAWNTGLGYIGLEYLVN